MLRKIFYFTLLAVMAAVTFVEVVSADSSAAESAGQTADVAKFCRDEGLPVAQCERITILSSKWRGAARKGLQIVLSPKTTEGPLNRPRDGSLSGDAAYAQAEKREQEIGACRFDEARDVIELKVSAFRFSDATLVQCLATAFAQARYSHVEGQWLNHLGEHEAWVVREGKATKVSSSDKKLKAAVARSLWASLATRELIAIAASAETTRALASSDFGSFGDAPTGTSDPMVAKLLGIASDD